MELTQLKYFVQLTESLNFTQAAKKLFITQSTLSQSIGNLERELGILLFDRIGRKVFLTAAGKAFLPYATATIKDAEMGIRHLMDMQDISVGELRIGIISGLIPIAVETINKFSSSYPNIKLHLTHSSSARELMNMVANDHVDFSISYLPGETQPSVKAVSLFDDAVVAMVSSNLKIPNEKTISLKSMGKHKFVLLEKGQYIRDVIDEMFSTSKITLKPTAEVNDSNLLMRLVTSGDWISIGASSTIAQNPILKAIPIKEWSLPLTAAVLQRNSAYHSNAEREFIRILQNNINRRSQ